MTASLLSWRLGREAGPRPSDRASSAAVAVATAIALLLIAATVHLSALRQDAIQREAERRIIEHSLETLGRAAARTVRDYARWDDAVARLVLELDPGWADRNVGPNLHETFGFEVSAVVAGDGRTVYGHLEGERTDADAADLLGPALHHLVRSAREGGEAHVPTPTVLKGEAGLFLTVASPILPERGSELQVRGPPAVLLIGDRLDHGFLRELGRSFALEDLAYAEAESDADHALVQLRDPTGAAVHGITWTPSRPGRTQVAWLLPAFAGAILLVVVFALLAIRAERLIRALRSSETRYRAVVEDQTELICRHLADTTLTFVNGAFCRYYGRTPDELLGRKLLELVPAEAHPRILATVAALRPGEVASLEHAVQRPDGTLGWQQWTQRAIGDPVVEFQGVGRDVTQQREAQARIRELALTDALTGLPNRRALLERLGSELGGPGTFAGPVALCLIDLDNFKQVNDSMGHSAGDRLLVEAAARLRETVRQQDFVARLGGDEFAVVVAPASGEGTAEAMARRLIDRLCEPYMVRDSELRVGASVGIASYPADADDAESLLAHADLALYASKAAGGGGWRQFRPAMQERVNTHAALDRDLRRAFERGEFALHFQPVVEVESLRLRAFEALLRWRHPEHGAVPPTAFLAAAERTRLIVPLTFWVVEEALRRAADWRSCGLGALQVAVNLAVSALDSVVIAEHAEAQLRAQALPGEALLVEVTEGVIADSRRVITTLHALRAVGVRVAIDDFGAGYSSLARLRDLPIDALKIDRSFVASPGGKGEAVLRAVVELARGLDLPTVVEGVENTDQLGMLRRTGVTCAQGYLLGRPMPADAVPAWARAWADGRLLAPAQDLLSRPRSSALPG